MQRTILLCKKLNYQSFHQFHAWKFPHQKISRAESLKLSMVLLLEDKMAKATLMLSRNPCVASMLSFYP